GRCRGQRFRPARLRGRCRLQARGRFVNEAPSRPLDYPRKRAGRFARLAVTPPPNPYAASRSSRACLLAASSPRVAPSIRTISATSSSPSTRSTVARAWPRRDCLTMRKWAWANEATCGRWVMQITWRSPPRWRSRPPTARAVLPPIPASISSKARVRSPRGCPRLVSASMILESSPPDAASRRGDGGIPGLGANPRPDRLGPTGAEPARMRVGHPLQRGILHREGSQLGACPPAELAGGLPPCPGQLRGELLPPAGRLREPHLDLVRSLVRVL